MRFIKYTLWLLALCLTACSPNKYIPEGEYMLDKAVILNEDKHKDKDISLISLRNHIRQKGNTRWLSIAKIPLATYSLSGKDSTKWINRVLKNMGEPPVIFDSVQAQLSCKDLQQQLQNEGFLRAKVDYVTRLKGKNRIDAVYAIYPGEPYYIRSMRYIIQDSVIDRLLGMQDTTRWGIHAGQRFNLTALDEERKRIATFLQDLGYYKFHKEFITYHADSIPGSTGIDLALVLRPYRTSTTPDTLHTRYRIRHVSYSSNHPEDSVIHLRKSVLKENTFMNEGKYYSASDLQNTYHHFGRLSAIKYTNIHFDEVTDSALLDCGIQLMTNKPSSISIQPEGTNTAGDLGAALTLSYQNRNLFKGSETFSVELRGAYEAIRGLEGYKNQNFLEYSVRTNLSFPRFILPFIGSDFRRRINASTDISIMYDKQDRPEFHRRLLSASLRYKWNFRNQQSHYQMDLLDINLVSMPWISETFKTNYLDNTTNRNAILAYNYRDLLIMKFGFGYRYSNRHFSIRTNIETAGNLLNLSSQIFKAKLDEDGHYRLFNIAYAQYVKGDIDYSRILHSTARSQLVFHVGLGIAYPYGNSTILPFEKRYFSGGANSVRGWSVRSLGPGRYRTSDGNINFITQTGDMKLDLNLEYRTHLFWKLGIAFFLDAGNIWTLRAYNDQPGGQFKFQNILKDLAVSYGLGFRFNFDFFILRFDMGMKAVNPAYQEGEEHFPIIHPKLSRDFAFHFAVGLPF